MWGRKRRYHKVEKGCVCLTMRCALGPYHSPIAKREENRRQMYKPPRSRIAHLYIYIERESKTNYLYRDTLIASNIISPVRIFFFPRQSITAVRINQLPFREKKRKEKQELWQTGRPMRPSHWPVCREWAWPRHSRQRSSSFFRAARVCSQSQLRDKRRRYHVGTEEDGGWLRNGESGAWGTVMALPLLLFRWSYVRFFWLEGRRKRLSPLFFWNFLVQYFRSFPKPWLPPQVSCSLTRE